MHERDEVGPPPEQKFSLPSIPELQKQQLQQKGSIEADNIHATNVVSGFQYNDNRTMVVIVNGIDIKGLNSEKEQLVRLVVEQGQQYASEGQKIGLTSGIAPPALSAVHQVTGDGLLQASSPTADPATALSGVRWNQPSLRSGDVERLRQKFSSLDRLLKQVDQSLSGQVQGIEEIQVGQEHLQVVDLLIQQGNLALWQFRHATSCLFGKEIAAAMLVRMTWPTPPEFQVLNVQARSNPDVLRGMALLNLLIPQRPELVLPMADKLSQGHWQQVLDEWVVQRQVPEEMVQLTRTQIEAIGEPYRPEEVQAAQKEAGVRFSEALQRQPQNTTALVNLAMLLVESATFAYIESGVANRTRLQRAHDLFLQASDLLAQRSDRESKIALGKCLLSLAMSLPPDAVLESVQWAATQTQINRATYSQQAQRTIRWDVFQRNMACRNPDFYQPGIVQQARDVFFASGEALLAEQCTRLLQQLEWMRTAIPQMTKQMQELAPVVGTWSYQGQNQLEVLSGVLVFDASGMFYWQAERRSMFGVSQHTTVVGNYQAMGMTISMNGQSWTQLLWSDGIPMSSRFFNQVFVQANSGSNLWLVTQQEGYQLMCQRQ